MRNNQSSNRRAKGSGSVFLRGKSYYLQYTINGKTKLKSLRTGKRLEAERIANELLNPVMHSNDKVQVIQNIATARKVILPSTLKLDDIWKAYIKTPAEDRPRSSKGTLGNYERNLKQFTDWIKLNHPSIKYLSDQIDKNIAKEYRDYLNNLDLADVTFNYKIGSLKLIFRILKDKTNLDSNVWDTIKRITHPRQETKQHFTFQQSEALLQVFEDSFRNKQGNVYTPMHKEQLRTLFSIGVYSGLRLIDCVHLKWENIKKFDTGLAIQCKPQKTIQFNKTITAPIVEPLQDALSIAEEWKNDTGYILPDIKKRYDYNASGVRKDVINVFKVAGYTTSRIKDGSDQNSRKYSAYGFHSVRHALFSFLCQRGVTIERLKKWSGDSEKTLLKYYLHADTEKLITEAQKALVFNDVKPIPEPERRQLIELANILSIDEIRKILKLTEGIKC